VCQSLVERDEVGYAVMPLSCVAFLDLEVSSSALRFCGVFRDQLSSRRQSGPPVAATNAPTAGANCNRRDAEVNAQGPPPTASHPRKR
jgi:hypothetical protein